MKYLLIFVIAMLVAWRWRTSRETAQQLKQKNAQPRPPQEMRKCAHCGVHLPVADVWAGAAGSSYCSEEHRRLAQG